MQHFQLGILQTGKHLDSESTYYILGYSLERHSTSLPELGDRLFDVRDPDPKSNYGERRCTS